MPTFPFKSCSAHGFFFRTWHLMFDAWPRSNPFYNTLQVFIIVSHSAGSQLVKVKIDRSLPEHAFFMALLILTQFAPTG